jgi:hypothetical protein
MMEALLLAEADELRKENAAAISAGRIEFFTTVFMNGGGGHYHRRAVLDAGVALVREQPAFEAIVFPCCGYAITETLVLEFVSPGATAVFMDRHVDRRVRRRDSDLEARSFEELSLIVAGLRVPTLVVGINSMVSDDRMRKDRGFPAFVAACLANAHVHRHAALAWIDHVCGIGASSAVVPLNELSTFRTDDLRVQHIAR